MFSTCLLPLELQSVDIQSYIKINIANYEIKLNLPGSTCVPTALALDASIINYAGLDPGPLNKFNSILFYVDITFKVRRADTGQQAMSG